MRLLHLRRFFLVFIILIVNTGYADNTSNQAFYQLADEYFDNLFLPAYPSQAVSLGVHRFDDKLENYSQSWIHQYTAQLLKFSKRVQQVIPDKLDAMAQGDRELILNNINSQLLTLQTIKPWQKNPDFYSGNVTNAAFVIMSRSFAPVNDRLRSLIAREKLIPAVFTEAKKNLVNPPKIFTQIALEQLPDIITFFQKDVPQAFAQATDEKLKNEFKQSNDAVIAALKSYQQWLQTDLLPRSNGSFKLGAETFSQKLKYDEMIDIPLPRLRAIGEANLRKNQQEYAKLVKELAEGGSDAAVIATLKQDHPAPDKLLSSFSDTFDSLIGFIRQKHIITIPSDVRPSMEETPPFLRAITFASMDTPGPFEKHATQAFFNVTLPESDWDKTKTADYMAIFNYPAIKSTAIHETYPGHYVQFLWMHDVKSRVRKILGAMSNAEGWAHYCEQMMLDEGYGQSSDTRANKLLRLGQLQNALLRNSRYMVAIKMHTENMTFDQAVDFFVNEGKQSRTAALVEVKRGTADPTYLIYTLGKLQIMKLRDDLAVKEGAKFNLQAFHDDFMRQGYPPIKIVRRALLGDESATL